MDLFKQKKGVEKAGFYTPCKFCLKSKAKCPNCLMFVLSDFAAVLNTDPKLAKEFEILYNKSRGHVETTRQERRTMSKNLNKRKKRISKLN